MTTEAQLSVDLIHETHTIEARDGAEVVLTRKHSRPYSAQLRPLLLVPGLCQNRYFWDLPGRSFAEYAAKAGHDVWIVEFRGHGLSRTAGSPYAQGVHEYIGLDMPAIIEHVYEKTGQPMVACGHSLGGAVLYAQDPHLHDKLRGLMLIASPFKFEAGFRQRWLSHFYGLLRRYSALRWLQPPHFGLDLVGGVLRRSLWYFDHPAAQTPFQIWLPRSIGREPLLAYLERGFDRTGFGVIEAMADWVITERYLDPLTESNYHDRMTNFPFPVLLVAGDRDQLVTPEDVRACADHLSSPRKTLKTFGPPDSFYHWGHVDLLLGDHAPLEVWTYLLEWIDEHIGKGPWSSVG